MSKLILIAALTLLMASCGTNRKMMTMFRKGTVVQTGFHSEIPFEMRLGLVVIQVKIAGKNYNFMVDTGAPNVITPELAAELGLKQVANSSVHDSQGRSDKLGLVEMPEMTIGGISFRETAAVVADLNRSRELACLHVDGFIGANLMKEAAWQFDYVNKKLTLADSAGAFTFPDGAYRIPFVPAGSFTPLIDISYGGIMDCRVTFDTGSNDYFLSSTDVYRKMKTAGAVTREVTSYGTSTSGLYGVGEDDTNHHVLVGETQAGSLRIPGQVVSFSEGKARTVGTRFLQHYRVILNWQAKEIILIPTDDFVNNTFASFGFTPMFDGTSLIVKRIEQGSDADSAGLKLNDMILEINGRSFREMTGTRWCELLYDEETFRTNPGITLLLRRDNQEQTVVLTRKDSFAR